MICERWDALDDFLQTTQLTFANVNKELTFANVNKKFDVCKQRTGHLQTTDSMFANIKHLHIYLCVTHTSIVPILFTHLFFILGRVSLVIIFVFIHDSFVSEYLHVC